MPWEASLGQDSKQLWRFKIIKKVMHGLHEFPQKMCDNTQTTIIILNFIWLSCCRNTKESLGFLRDTTYSDACHHPKSPRLEHREGGVYKALEFASTIRPLQLQLRSLILQMVSETVHKTLFFGPRLKTITAKEAWVSAWCVSAFLVEDMGWWVVRLWSTLICVEHR
jgi:hypothetical protein